MSRALDSLGRLRERAGSDGAERPAWLAAARDEAWTTFVAAGFPTRRLEAWKSTNLAPLEALDFASASAGKAGVVAPTAAGIRVRSLASLLREDPEPSAIAARLGRLADPKSNPLVALAMGCFEDCLVVELDRGVRASAPIRIRFEDAVPSDPSDPRPQPCARFTRLLVLADERSEAALELEHAAANPGFTSHVAEIYVAAGARIELVEIQPSAAPQIHFSSVHAEVERAGHFASHVVTLSDALVRSELFVRLLEPGAGTTMNGFLLGAGRGHVDHFTTVEHAAPHCTSAQEYRSVFGDHAQGVFRGRVVVRPGAQKTDASQSNPNLLLSGTASVDARPQLEIYADDVRASHGSTIGQLDADALFFLRARGIGEAEARQLLTRAFAQRIVDAVGDATLRDSLAGRIDMALAVVAPSAAVDAPSAPASSTGERARENDLGARS